MYVFVDLFIYAFMYLCPCTTGSYSRIKHIHVHRLKAILRLSEEACAARSGNQTCKARTERERERERETVRVCVDIYICIYTHIRRALRGAVNA